MKNIIINILEDFKEYFNSESEYAKGYFDALFEVCRQTNIKSERTEHALHILEVQK